MTIFKKNNANKFNLNISSRELLSHGQLQAKALKSERFLEKRVFSMDLSEKLGRKLNPAMRFQVKQVL